MMIYALHKVWDGLEYDSIKELKADLEDYFYFYNYCRFHQTLDYKKPMEVYDKKRYLKIIQHQKIDFSDKTLKKAV